MRKIRRNTKLWLYLYQSGILASNDETLIKQKVSEYWKLYDKERKKRKRAIKTEYTISFTKKEVKALKYIALNLGFTIPEYIKQLVYTNIKTHPFTPYAQSIKHIEQLLIHYKNKINEIAKKEVKNFLGINKNYDVLTDLITQIQTTLADTLKQTPTLQETIKTALNNNPMFIQTLQHLMQSYNDTQKPNT